MHTDNNLESAFEELFNDIGFTIEAYTKKAPLKKIILAGPAVDIPHIDDYITKKMNVPTSLFDTKQLIRNGLLKSKVTQIPNNAIVSIASALPITLTQDFTLLQAEAFEREDQALTKQLITLGILCLLLFLTFSMYSFFRVRNLKKAGQVAEKEAIEALQRSFKLRGAQNLEAANKTALNELKRQETTWARLSEAQRSSFLRSLIELSRCISVKDTQLELTRLIMKDDTIKLYGSVPGYQQLTKLQAQLECPRFKKLPKLQDWNFKTEPITLTVQDEGS